MSNLSDYWKKLQGFIRSQGSGSTFEPALDREWMFVLIDAEPSKVIVSYRKLNQSLQVSLRIVGKRAEEYYNKLYEDREAIEQELGCGLDWKGSKESWANNVVYQVQCYRRNTDLEDRSRWGDYMAWQADMAEQFRKSFRPRIKRLNLELDDLGD